MPSQPLQPFAPPTVLLSYMPGGLSTGLVVNWMLYAVFVFWGIYTAIIIYHWIKYSHASWIAFPSIAVHLGVSLVLMGYAISGALYV